MAGFFTRRKILLLIIFVAIFIAGVALRRTVTNHLRSMSVLLRLSNPRATGFQARFAQHPFSEKNGTAQSPAGPFRYRIYEPRDIGHPGGMVLLHGVHRLGIDEPRLVNFSRALAGAGIEVMTPELKDLADYKVTPQSIDEIGTAAVLLSKQMNRPSVGLMGFSFAGGLALLAASKPEYEQNVGFVVAIGSHDDLGRVSRFFATNTIEKPDGTMTPFQAHEYGALILVYQHLDGFFSSADEPVARQALHSWLWEHADEALKIAQQLSPAGREEFDRLVHHRDQLRQQLLDEIEAHKADMAAVSPHGQLQNLKVPVFLLHGAGDSVVPASETLWLAQDIPDTQLKEALISPAFIHVNMGETIPVSQKWALLHFLAQVLGSADAL